MKNFMTLYVMPTEGIDEWMAKPEAERKEAEDKMKEDLNAWFAAHSSEVLNSVVLGKTKKVTSNGVEDTRNGFVMSSYVAAESLEAAAEIFKDHPHLTMPGATIEVVETRAM